MFMGEIIQFRSKAAIVAEGGIHFKVKIGTFGICQATWAKYSDF